MNLTSDLGLLDVNNPEETLEKFSSFVATIDLASAARTFPFDNTAKYSARTLSLPQVSVCELNERRRKRASHVKICT